MCFITSRPKFEGPVSLSSKDLLGMLHRQKHHRGLVTDLWYYSRAFVETLQKEEPFPYSKEEGSVFKI